MSFGSFGEGQNMPMADINTTPLVDVMLVLLVIFIITAPLFHQAIPVDLPQVSSSKLDDKPAVVQLAIDAQGVVFINGEAVHRDSLDAQFGTLRTGDPELHLRADRATRYEVVADVMAAAQRNGLMKIAFVTQPQETR